MILDGSAVVAVLLDQPEAGQLTAAIATGVPSIGAPTLAETGIVLTARLGVVGRSLLGRFLQEAGVSVLEFTDAHWSVSVDAFARFGRGRHPAALNFGDCLTYASASLSGEPLLCLGDDFARTDLELVALAPAS